MHSRIHVNNTDSFLTMSHSSNRHHISCTFLELASAHISLITLSQLTAAWWEMRPTSRQPVNVIRLPGSHQVLLVTSTTEHKWLCLMMLLLKCLQFFNFSSVNGILLFCKQNQLCQLYQISVNAWMQHHACHTTLISNDLSWRQYNTQTETYFVV